MEITEKENTLVIDVSGCMISFIYSKQTKMIGLSFYQRDVVIKSHLVTLLKPDGTTYVIKNRVGPDGEGVDLVSTLHNVCSGIGLSSSFVHLKYLEFFHKMNKGYGFCSKYLKKHTM